MAELNAKKLLQTIAPLALGIIIALFVYNIYSHATGTHPGSAQYKDKCAQCHGDNGEGIKVLVPPLMNSDYAAKNIDSLPCWLKFGLNHPITVRDTLYDQPMYPVELDEVQVANVINYMNKEFWHSNREVNSGWVKEQWKKCN